MIIKKTIGSYDMNFKADLYKQITMHLIGIIMSFICILMTWFLELRILVVCEVKIS